MDTSRKTLTDTNTCYYCTHYQQLIGEHGKKTCSGICRKSGIIKARTSIACKKSFRSKNQIGLFGIS